MAFRTNLEEVKDVLMDDYNSSTSPNLTPFIRIANLIVSRVNTCATNKGITLSTDELKEIETWVAAHAYCASDQPYSSRRTLDASGVFQGITGKALEGTKYGQMAMSLDISGCLRAISEQRRAGLSWLGKPVSEQIDYRDRD